MKLKRVFCLMLASLMAVSLVACGDKTSKDNDEPQLYGYIGDTLSTAWFDFTVKDAYLCGEYEGYTAASSNKQLLVVSLKLENTFPRSVSMFREDFPVLWDWDEETAAADDDGMAYPIDAFTDDQLPDEYDLGIKGKESGLLVYEVPVNTKDFSLAFMEIYEDDEEGNVFFVDFTPTQK